MKTRMKPDVRILYVEEFKYKNTPVSPHPKQGRIYRAVKRPGPNTTIYQIFYDDPEVEDLGMFVSDLKMDTELFKAHFREVTLDELADMDIDVEDFLQLASWGDDLTDGLDPALINAETMYERNQEPVALGDLARRVAGVIVEEVQKASPSTPLDKLKSVDPKLWAGATVLLEALYKSLVKDADKQITRPLVYSKKFGSGANTFAVLKYMEQYADRGEVSNLVEAFKHLLFELTRKQQDGIN